MRPSPSALVAVRTAHRCAVAASLLVLAACSSTAPTVRLHTLMPAELVPSGAAPGARTGAATIAIVLEPIRVPAQVDQPQWLVRLPDDSLAVLEQERWASPLRDELRDALLEELAAGYGAVEARSAVAGSAPPVRIAVDVRRFESLPGREARSDGSWTLAGGGASAPAIHCEWLIRERAPGPIGALAAAHRRAVARLGAAIGGALVAAKAGQAVTCPPLDDRR
jgi:uncharacterized lipoprotein YmbA